jgi:hypothetical protein
MAILWIIGWLAFMVSLINLLRMLVRSRRLGFPAFKPSLRPILTIVFVLFDQLSIQMSVARANEFGRKAAEGRSNGGVTLNRPVLRASQVGLHVRMLLCRRPTLEHGLNIECFTV